MKRKKYRLLLAFLLAVTLILTSGCAQSDRKGEHNKNASKVILCAGFSEYDWTRNVLGDNPAGIELHLLNTGGVDMHSYQPSVSDMVQIADCDLLIYTGGISEFWIDKAAVSSKKGSISVLSLMAYFEQNPDLFPTYEQEEHDHNHGHEHEHEDEDANLRGHEQEEADEHIWLSLKMAPVFCEKIADAVSQLDPANRDLYRKNLEDYRLQLSALDVEFSRTVSSASDDALLFADRFPFLYMTQDYGIHSHAAFPGCSAETEASFETIIDLANDLVTDELSHIIILKNSRENLAQTIIRASGKSGIKVCELDSLQSVTSEEIEEGFTYLNAMRKNKEVISECLN